MPSATGSRPSFTLHIIALSGFVVSLGVHLLSHSGIGVPGLLFAGLHLGAMALIGLGMLSLAQTVVRLGITRGQQGRLLWSGPLWLRGLLALVFCYALLNFAGGPGRKPSESAPQQNNQAETARAFSGHWMLFYLLAALLHHPDHGARLLRSQNPKA